MYDGQTVQRPPINAIGDRDDSNPAEGGISFRLEIVAISGREGEKLQAIQARAIRDALLWAIEQQARDDPGEGK
ncbi:hypothetical protein DLJ59_32740 [Micromonospora inaquosa]|uniref:Uncharacterized protein n=1 Tax=Micromonospora inaquosa TaxID=2203716 RepID=A0A3N9W3W2_9ACTN|nr:hypothetical protein DLJ59_32740 [Micromonospora inaquosa]